MFGALKIFLRLGSSFETAIVHILLWSFFGPQNNRNVYKIVDETYPPVGTCLSEYTKKSLLSNVIGRKGSYCINIEQLYIFENSGSIDSLFLLWLYWLSWCTKKFWSTIWKLRVRRNKWFEWLKVHEWKYIENEPNKDGIHIFGKQRNDQQGY